MKARRVERACADDPLSVITIVCLLLVDQVLALVLSIVESCHGIRNRLSATTAR